MFPILMPAHWYTVICVRLLGWHSWKIIHCIAGTWVLGELWMSSVVRTKMCCVFWGQWWTVVPWTVLIYDEYFPAFLWNQLVCLFMCDHAYVSCSFYFPLKNLKSVFIDISFKWHLSDLDICKQYCQQGTPESTKNENYKTAHCIILTKLPVQ